MVVGAGDVSGANAEEVSDVESGAGAGFSAQDDSSAQINTMIVKNEKVRIMLITS